MNLLLDTHILIWWLKKDRELSKVAETLIKDAENVYVSSVSIWEIAIKIKIGKLQLNLNDLLHAVSSEDFIQLPLTAKHAAIVAEPPDHHRDPFDRALIAQATSEHIYLLTADEILKSYSELIYLV